MLAEESRSRLRIFWQNGIGRKDLRDEITNQEYCTLYVAASNLCQYPELLPNHGDVIDTFSAGGYFHIG